MVTMLGRRKPATVSSVADAWTVAQGSYNGHPMLVRINTAYRETSDRGEYPIRIGVALPVNQPDDRGWPGSEEGHQLQDAEDKIVRAVRGRAVLVAVITGKNMREFVFHAHASDWIADFDQEASAAVTSHELQVMAQLDPDWNVYASLLSG